MDCKTGTKNIIKQIVQLLETLNQEQFNRPLSIYNGSSLGQHFRHIFDFYQCLFDGIPQGVIDYAKRSRDNRIEQDPQYAKDSFGQVLQAITALNEYEPVQVVADFSANIIDSRPTLASTIGRELMFAHDHAVHHIAIIKIGFQQTFPEIPIPIELGVAPSTLKHQAGQVSLD